MFTGMNPTKNETKTDCTSEGWNSQTPRRNTRIDKAGNVSERPTNAGPLSDMVTCNGSAIGAQPKATSS